MRNTITQHPRILFFGSDGKIQEIVRNHFGAKIDLLKIISLFADTSIFVDIGANVGQTMISVYAENPSVRYFGFEPNSIAFVRLQYIAKINNINSILFPWACSDCSLPIKLYFKGGTDTAATIRKELRQDTYGLLPGSWISAYPLDAMESELNLGMHFVLKIDTEGAELGVLRGAVKLIEKYRPVILCEVLNAHSGVEMEDNDNDKLKIEQFLEAVNYRMYLCKFDPADREGNGQLLGLIGLKEFPKKLLYINSSNANDYVFLPNELPDIEF